MLFLITYDITDDKRRNRIASLLEGYGVRVNFSVFECELSAAKLESLKNEILKIITKADNVRFYALCQNCQKKSFELGKRILTLSDDDLFIR